MQKEGSNHEQVKKVEELANAWSHRFDQVLEHTASNPDLTFEELSSLMWEKGILEHISPSNPAEFSARKELGKLVLKRDDPELYARLIYCAKNIEHGIKNNLSLASGYLPIIKTAMTAHNNPSINKQIKPDRLITDLLENVEHKSQEHLKQLGIEDFKTVPIGARGIYKDITVTVPRYSLEGLPVLEALDYEGHKKLGEATNFTNTISPLEINPENFK